jgi:small subunit ribosomal protein S16
MVRIRLRRVGFRNQPSYRIVVAEKESPRDGRFLEIVGFYNPRSNPSQLDVKEERVYHWLGKGAQPSESVTSLFKQAGLLDRFTRLQTGENMEKLLEEAKAAYQNRLIKEPEKK